VGWCVASEQTKIPVHVAVTTKTYGQIGQRLLRMPTKSGTRPLNAQDTKQEFRE
jgi:hypothetical protein